MHAHCTAGASTFLMKAVCVLQALRDMDTEMLRKLLGNVNLPSWINFPGM